MEVNNHRFTRYWRLFFIKLGAELLLKLVFFVRPYLLFLINAACSKLLRSNNEGTGQMKLIYVGLQQ